MSVAIEFTSKSSVERYAEGVTAEELQLRPVLLELVGNVQEKTIWDVGCGDGRYSVIFAANGATVIATDFSAHQIDIAKQKHAHQNVTYSVGDISTGETEPASVDIAFANLVIPSLGSAEKLLELIKSVRKILKPDGRFIFSVLHPLYLVSDQDGFDNAVDFDPRNYFAEGSSFRAEAQTNAGNTMVFDETHFSLSYISRLLKDEGFAIQSLVESKQIPEKQMFLPKYLVFECTRTSAS